jgi:hypothetical protein
VSAPARFAEPPLDVPAFLDPDRRAKIAAVVPKLDAHFAELMAKSKIPGLAVGLVVDGDLVWSKGYGVRSLDGKEPVDADTVFRLASITKSFTGMAVLQQRDAGKLTLDAPAEGVVPELAGVVYPTRDAPRITLRHLLTHRAALPHEAPATIDATHSPSLDEVAKSVAGLVLDAPPGVANAYSNLGFALAGLAAAAPKLAALVGRWDDKAFDAIAAPSVARAKVRAAFAEAGATHGRCRVGAPDEGGDKTHARFPLACDRGAPVVLRAALDERSGKVTEVALGAPRGRGRKCP